MRILTLGFALALVFMPWSCHSAKFIMFAALGSYSHLNPFYSIGEALVEKGHEVTIIQAFGPRAESSKVKTVIVDSVHNALWNNKAGQESTRNMVSTMTGDKGGSSFITTWVMMVTAFPNMCSIILDDPKVKEIVDAGMQYDVAINNYFMNDCTLPITKRVAKYTVLAGATTMMNHIAYGLNIPHPLSYIPNMALSYVAPMNFLERAVSSLFGVVWLASQPPTAYRTINRIVKERYPELPTVQETLSNVSFVLINHNSASDGAIPSVPYSAEIGGIHLRPPKPLPKEFDSFIKGGGNAGFIYVSLGSVVPEEMMPEARKKIFIEAFSKLPYRVIWKFKEQRTDLPPNVMTSKFAPQLDLLGDPRCKAFISHGGHASLDEATYSGVPVIGMPIFGDQPANVQKAVHKGYAVELQWDDLTVESLLQRVNEAVKNPKYKEAAGRIAKKITDQPQKPLERAVFWLEYVIRHDGAKHLRTAADHLNFFQYFLLDVIAAAALVLTLVIYVICKLIRMICCRSKSGQKGKKKVKKN